MYTIRVSLSWYLLMEGVLPSACGQNAPLRDLLYAALFHAELV
jgi:hypothetical protein